MKVICKLPNAGDLINGVQFLEHKMGKISEEITDEVAEHFLKIPGYVRVGVPPAKAAPTTPTPSAPTGGDATGGDAATSNAGAAGGATDAGAASGEGAK